MVMGLLDYLIFDLSLNAFEHFLFGLAQGELGGNRVTLLFDQLQFLVGQNQRTSFGRTLEKEIHECRFTFDSRCNSLTFKLVIMLD